jgi:hypothetical protein
MLKVAVTLSTSLIRSSRVEILGTVHYPELVSDQNGQCRGRGQTPTLGAKESGKGLGAVFIR